MPERDELDFLAEIIAEGTALDPVFPAMVAAAEQERALEREAVARWSRLRLVEEGHEERGETQTRLPRSQRHPRRTVTRRERRKG